MANIAKLTEWFEPAVEQVGSELWGVEYIQGSPNTLRVYIDKTSGVVIDDCVAATHEINAILDVEDPIGGNYTLEVSSPGIDRPLFKIEHFMRFIGESVKLRLHVAYNGRRNFRATITKVEGELVGIATNEGDFCFNINEIEKAQLIAA